MDKDLETLLNMNRAVNLYDIYATLLPKRSKEVLNYYFNEDWSIIEIADLLDISRQAVYDSLKSGINKLEKLEAQLSIYAQGQDKQDKLKELSSLIRNNRLEEARALIDEMLK